MKILPPAGPERRRSLVLLAVLVLAGGGYYWWQARPGTAGTPAAASKGEERSSAAATPIPLPSEVKLRDLVPAPDAADSTRNPFKFGQKPLPPAPPAPPPQPVVAAPPTPPPPPAGPPPIPLKCLGVLQAADTKQWQGRLQYQDTGEAFWVIEGTVIDGKYKVGSINSTGVKVSYRDGSGAQLLRPGS